MANEIFTRIQLKHDTYANWMAVQDTFKPLAGEICVVEIPSANSATTTTPPTVLFKVGMYKKDAQGNDTTELYTFKELNWGSALAADVYAWAKEQSMFSSVVATETTTGEGDKQKTYVGNAVTNVEWDSELNNGKGGIKFTKGTQFATKAELDAALEAFGGDLDAITDTDTRYSFEILADGDNKGKLAITAVKYTNGTAEGAGTTTYYDFVTPGELETFLEGYVVEVKGADCIEVDNTDPQKPTVKHAVPTGATEGEHSATTKGHLLKSVTTDKFGHIVSTDETSLTFDLSESLTNGTDLYLKVGTDLASGIRFEGENGISVYGTASYEKIMVDGSELKTAIGNNTSAIATLNGNDTGKSARAIATEVAKAEIGSAGHLKREIVTEIPAVEDADPDTIYMIKSFVDYEYIGTGEVGDDGILDLDSDTAHVYGVTALPGTTIVARSGVNFVEGTVYVQVDGNKYAPTGVSFTCDSDDSPCFIDLPHGPVGNRNYILITSGDYINSIEPVAEGDQYTEFILIDKSLVQIGNTSVDLTSYVTETELWDTLQTLNLPYSIEEGKYVTAVTQSGGKIAVYRKQISYNELADVPTNHKIQQTPVSNQQLSGANIVEGVSQTANGEITVHSRTLTPADIGAQPVGNYKTTQSEVTKTGSTVKTVTSVKQNANGEITEVKFEDIAFPAPPTASGAATIATVANDVVTLKAGAVLNENHTLANNASADITLAKVAKTGSIYDLKEGTNDNKGSDKEAHPKYLIFNCGSATTVI